MLTKDQAIDKLVHLGQNDLAELVYYAHKDQYNIKGCQYQSKSVPELVSWYITHYIFNETFQCWETIIPFEE
jgi:hypothetical protein